MNKIYRLFGLTLAVGLLGSPSDALAAKKKKKPPVVEEPGEEPVVEEGVTTEEQVPELVEETPRRFLAGVTAGSPEVVSAFLRLQASKAFSLQLAAAPSITVHRTFEVPQLTVAANQSYKLVTEATTADVDIHYGPQVSLDGRLSFTEHWFGFAGLGYRKITAVATGQSSLLACAASQAVCASGGGADGPSAIEVALTGTVVSTSMLGRLGGGYEWHPGPRATISLTALGLSTPVSTTRSTNIDAQTRTTYGPILQAIVARAVDQILADQEDELSDQILAEITPYDSQTLPIISLGLGYAF